MKNLFKNTLLVALLVLPVHAAYSYCEHVVERHYHHDCGPCVREEPAAAGVLAAFVVVTAAMIYVMYKIEKSRRDDRTYGCQRRQCPAAWYHNLGSLVTLGFYTHPSKNTRVGVEVAI